MFVHIMVGIVGVGVIIIVLFMLLLVFLGVQIVNRIDDAQTSLHEINNFLQIHFGSSTEEEIKQ